MLEIAQKHILLSWYVHVGLFSSLLQTREDHFPTDAPAASFRVDLSCYADTPYSACAPHYLTHIQHKKHILYKGL